MPIYKEVWQFLESNGSGFNEVWYSQSASITNASNFTGEFLNFRLALLHPLNVLQRIRVSQVGSNRLTANVTIAKSGTFKAVQGPLAVGAAIVCGLTGALGGQRKWWMRGCPADFYVRDAVSGRDAPPASLLNALDVWFRSLAGNSYGINRLTPGASQGMAGAGSTPIFRITSVDGTIQNGTSVITFSPQWTPPTPGRLVIGGASKKDLPALNGHWSSTQNAMGQTVIPYVTPGNAKVLSNSATVKAEIYQTFSIFNPAGCAFDHMGTRTSRNPLSASRGARRAARLRNVP